MENKYYTPSIEEFHIGFEYEYKYKENSWVKTTFSNSGTDEMTGDYYEFDPENPNTLCRIKYLDKEDIESFQIPLDEWFTSKHKYQGVYRVEAHGLQINPRVTIKTKDFIRDGSGNYVETIKVYRLNIKNKTEFGKLLKQSNIL